MENFFVYILYSEKFDKFYIGQTNNYESRLQMHNSGHVKSTSPFIPWIRVCLIQKVSRADAMTLEKKIKNLNRKRLLDFIEKYN